MYVSLISQPDTKIHLPMIFTVLAHKSVYSLDPHLSWLHKSRTLYRGFTPHPNSNMDDSYLYAPSDPGLSKAAKWLVFLLVLKVKKPVQWSAFLALNPTIRSLLIDHIKPKRKDPETVNRRVRKLSNLISVSFLYLAVSNNIRIPKDYVLIYIYMTYYGELNPPSSKIIVSPTTAKYFKISAYKKDSLLRKLYEKKHFVIFPVIFGQLLSNYLTPTRYKLNQKYLSSSIKSLILNPIWINFSMGVNSQVLNWAGLLRAYVKHNVYLVAYFAVSTFREQFLTHYYELKNDTYRGNGGVREIITNYAAYVANKANSMANFIYGPNLFSMFLLALTAPMLTKYSMLRDAYLSNVKLVMKTYIKVIGFIAAFSTMCVNAMDFVPSFGYRPLDGDAKSETSNVRRLGTTFMDGLNMYLFRLIILSKWRIVKENHPWFSILKVGTWERIESVVMCYGVWKLMNLNDYISKNKYGPASKECDRLALQPIMKGINKLMDL